jgi:hypothetical protein
MRRQSIKENRMKKSLPFASTLCFFAAQFLASPTASVFAQGTVIFNNRSSGTTHVYALGSPFDLRVVGNGTNDGPPVGSVDYGGRAYIGANGTGGQYGAATTLAQLLGEMLPNRASYLQLIHHRASGLAPPLVALLAPLPLSTTFLPMHR